MIMIKKLVTMKLPIVLDIILMATSHIWIGMHSASITDKGIGAKKRQIWDWHSKKVCPTCESILLATFILQGGQNGGLIHVNPRMALSP